MRLYFSIEKTGYDKLGMRNCNVRNDKKLRLRIIKIRLTI